MRTVSALPLVGFFQSSGTVTVAQSSPFQVSSSSRTSGGSSSLKAHASHVSSCWASAPASLSVSGAVCRAAVADWATPTPRPDAMSASPVVAAAPRVRQLVRFRVVMSGLSILVDISLLA